jgi:hypothetical protein
MLRRNISLLLVTAIVVRSLLILLALIMGAKLPSETSIITRTTRRIIPEDSILHSHCRDNLKTYISKIIEFTGVLENALDNCVDSIFTTFLNKYNTSDLSRGSAYIYARGKPITIGHFTSGSVEGIKHSIELSSGLYHSDTFKLFQFIFHASGQFVYRILFSFSSIHE